MIGQADDDDDDDDDGNTSDDEEVTFAEDEGFPSNYKELKVHMKSLRLDTVVGSGLNIARK